jgi:hypothetical protein
VMGLIAMIGRSAFNLPRAVAIRTYLASPFAFDDAEGARKLARRLGEQNVELINPGLQATACAAVDLFAEAAKHAGKRLSARKWMDALEQVRDFHSPLMPNFAFSSKNRLGSAGAFIFGVDPDEKRFLPINDWVSPTSE